MKLRSKYTDSVAHNYDSLNCPQAVYPEACSGSEQASGQMVRTCIVDGPSTLLKEHLLSQLLG